GTEPVLDQQAKDAFRRRLAELGEELEEARSWNDPERAARVEAGVGGAPRAGVGGARRASRRLSGQCRRTARGWGNTSPRRSERAGSARTHLPGGSHPPGTCERARPGTVVPPGFRSEEHTSEL